MTLSSRPPSRLLSDIEPTDVTSRMFAELLGVSVTVLARLLRDPQCPIPQPDLRLSARRHRWRRSTIERFLAAVQREVDHAATS